jgi:hypothetical protein
MRHEKHTQTPFWTFTWTHLEQNTSHNPKGHKEETERQRWAEKTLKKLGTAVEYGIVGKL